MSRQPFHPLGGPDTLVDKMVGNAYEQVKLVAINLPYIKHVSDQLENIYNISQSLTEIQAVGSNLDAVQAVARITDEITAVAADLDKVVTVATNITRIIEVANALPSLTSATERQMTLGAVGTSSNIPLAGIDRSKITGINLLVVGTDSNLYFNATYSVVGNNIVVNLPAGSPAPMAGGLAKAHITYLP